MTMTTIASVLRARALRAVIALSAVAVVSVLGAGGVESEGSPAPDQIWRSIFARPAARAVDEFEAKKQALGEKLFSDTRLSRDGDRSCASCHRPESGYSDGLRQARGRDGTALKRNTPHLFNLAEGKAFYWDGREPTLESQARIPLTAENELAADWARTLADLGADPEMRAQFAVAFPDGGVSEDTVIAALAAYERSLVSPVTAFDRWAAGDEAALSEPERRGFRIFAGKGGCVGCHGGWRMTDDGLHDIGVDSDDPGRSVVAGGAAVIPAFKTPGLRQVSKTAPYMHNGSLATLEDVVAHYAGGHLKRPSLAPNLVRDLELDAQERAALVAFLKTL
jgi:cytochrome c peroxidase